MASDHAIELTVLFSTHNGASSLPRMLEAFEGLEAPSGGWKIVAVDNASTDDTAAILTGWALRLPLTLLHEPRTGKSIGLNTGLSAVEGELVVFTDDDVLPSRDWLTSITRIADEQPLYDIFGGAIEPVWPSPPPEWLLQRAPKGCLGWTDFTEGPVDANKVWGGNMIVRRNVARRFRFREDIGPNGDADYVTGEETEFLMRAVDAGHLCWHSPRIRVGHLIEPHQLTAEWLLERCYIHARGARRISGLYDSRKHLLFGHPRYLLRRYARAAAGVAWTSMFGDFEARFDALRTLRELQGDITERALLMRGQKKLQDQATPSAPASGFG